MQLGTLEHVNLRTNQLDQMIQWYTEVLGMTQGFRPDFAFPGAWLYASDKPFIHLVGISDKPGVGSEVKLKLEHFAFSATGLKEFEDRLQKTGQRYDRSDIAQINLALINVWDPDGNHIHIDFPLDESST